MRHAAVDPGHTGHTALFEDGTPLDVVPNPLTPHPAAPKSRIHNPHQWAKWCEDWGLSHVTVETQQPRPGEGARAARTAITSHTVIWVVPEFLGIPVYHANPATWTKALEVGSDKRQHVEHAATLYPHLVDRLYGPRGGIRDGAADALLIGHWWWTRVHGR